MRALFLSRTRAPVSSPCPYVTVAAPSRPPPPASPASRTQSRKRMRLLPNYLPRLPRGPGAGP